MHEHNAIEMPYGTWVNAEIFAEEGKTTNTKNLTRYRRAVQKMTIFQRAEGANENYCVFATF